MVWVTPTALDSDHALSNNGSGPSWVAAIVNAVGESQYWKNTAIFVTWDDWGGWYDHVKPQIYNSYELGFRVPLIVISPYAKNHYVSHAQHEFGSIFNFTEKIFGLPSMHTTDARADDLFDCFDFNKSPTKFKPIPRSILRATFMDCLRRSPTIVNGLASDVRRSLLRRAERRPALSDARNAAGANPRSERRDRSAVDVAAVIHRSIALGSTGKAMTTAEFPARPRRSSCGSLYGTTEYGGTTNVALRSGCGTVFRISPSTATRSVIYRFSGADGSIPARGLTVAGGFVLGTTIDGGAIQRVWRRMRHHLQAQWNGKAETILNSLYRLGGRRRRTGGGIGATWAALSMARRSSVAR